MGRIKSICQICNQEFTSKLKLSNHIESEHHISKSKYYDVCHNTNSICMKCGKEAYSKTYFSEPKKYCLEHVGEFGSCLSIWYYLSRGYTKEEGNQKIKEKQQRNSYNGNKKYSKEILLAEGFSEEDAEKIVKERLKKNPRRREHYNSDEEYYSELNRFTKAQKDVFSKKIKGYYSCWSKNFYKYENLTDNEKIYEINKNSFSKENKNLTEDEFKRKCNTYLEFYLNKNMSLEEAKEALRQRQNTFSLKKCIEKYGNDLGIQKFEDRQKKWIKSLNENPENKEKLENGRIKGLEFSKSGYSKIGLSFFKSILKNIDLSSFTIFYKDPDNNKIEKCIYTESGPKFLDFYIKELNFALEFDGTYWHKNNEEKDALRDIHLKNKIKDLQIIHVKEKDYNNNRDECLKSVLKIIERLKNNYERNDRS